MHPQTTINQFIDLRSQGFSLARIADQLGLSKRTLIDWNREHQADITALRALELEAFHEKILASHEQELSRLAACQSKIDEELAKRSLETLPTDKLFRLSLLVRREIRSLCAAASPAGKGAFHSVPDLNTTNGPSSPIKPNQAPDIFSGHPATESEPVASSQSEAVPPFSQSKIQHQKSKMEQQDVAGLETNGSPEARSAAPGASIQDHLSSIGDPVLHPSSPIKVNQAQDIF